MLRNFGDMQLFTSELSHSAIAKFQLYSKSCKQNKQTIPLSETKKHPGDKVYMMDIYRLSY